MSYSTKPETVATQRTYVEREMTSGMAREETSRKPDNLDARADIRRRAGHGATAVELNQLAKRAVVNRPRLAVARERIPGMVRKKHGESSGSPAGQGS